MPDDPVNTGFSAFSVHLRPTAHDGEAAGGDAGGLQQRPRFQRLVAAWAALA